MKNKFQEPKNRRTNQNTRSNWFFGSSAFCFLSPASPSSASSVVAVGAVGTIGHVGVDEYADRLVPGGNFLVRGHVAPAALVAFVGVVRFEAQIIVDFVIVRARGARGGPALVARRPETLWFI